MVDPKIGIDSQIQVGKQYKVAPCLGLEGCEEGTVTVLALVLKYDDTKKIVPYLDEFQWLDNLEPDEIAEAKDSGWVVYAYAHDPDLRCAPLWAFKEIVKAGDKFAEV